MVKWLERSTAKQEDLDSSPARSKWFFRSPREVGKWFQTLHKLYTLAFPSGYMEKEFLVAPSRRGKIV